MSVLRPSHRAPRCERGHCACAGQTPWKALKGSRIGGVFVVAAACFSALRRAVVEKGRGSCRYSYACLSVPTVLSRAGSFLPWAVACDALRGSGLFWRTQHTPSFRPSGYSNVIFLFYGQRIGALEWFARTVCLIETSRRRT